MKIVFSRVFLLALFCLPNDIYCQKSIEEYGVFYKYFMNTSMQLHFDEGSFRFEMNSSGCTGGTSNTIIIGTYKQEGKRLNFFPTFYRGKGYDNKVIEKTQNITDFEGDYELCMVDSAVLLLKLDEIYRKEAPAMWSANEFMFLISDINERESAWFARMWSTREIGEHFGLDQSFKKHVPERWKEYFLKNPVEAEMTAYELLKQNVGTHMQYIVTLNKGTIDGLRYGMRLFSGDAQIRLIELNETACKGYLHCQPYLTDDFLASKPIFSTLNKKLLRK